MRPLLITAALLHTACVQHERHPPYPDDSWPLEPRLEIAQGRIRFDAVDLANPDAETRARVTVSNAGQGLLALQRLDVGEAGDPDAFSIHDLQHFLIEPGEATTFDLAFHPDVPGTYRGRVLLDSNDPETPTAVVRLEGEAF